MKFQIGDIIETISETYGFKLKVTENCEVGADYVTGIVLESTNRFIPVSQSTSRFSPRAFKISQPNMVGKILYYNNYYARVLEYPEEGNYFTGDIIGLPRTYIGRYSLLSRNEERLAKNIWKESSYDEMIADRYTNYSQSNTESECNLKIGDLVSLKSNTENVIGMVNYVNVLSDKLGVFVIKTTDEINYGKTKNTITSFTNWEKLDRKIKLI